MTFLSGTGDNTAARNQVNRALDALARTKGYPTVADVLAGRHQSKFTLNAMTKEFAARTGRTIIDAASRGITGHEANFITIDDFPAANIRRWWTEKD